MKQQEKKQEQKKIEPIIDFKNQIIQKQHYLIKEQQKLIHKLFYEWRKRTNLMWFIITVLIILGNLIITLYK